MGLGEGGNDCARERQKLQSFVSDGFFFLKLSVAPDLLKSIFEKASEVHTEKQYIVHCVEWKCANA